MMEKNDFKHKNIAIIGFGSQAKAWALNLRDSGNNVGVYLRENSPSLKKVQELGFDLIGREELASYNIIALLTPDDTHKEVLNDLQNNLLDKSLILYAHGYSLHYENLHELYSKFHHALLAPKAIASELRFQYELGGKLAGVISAEYIQHTDSSSKSEQDQIFKNPLALLRNIAADLGLTFIHQSSSQQETQADLFSEQSLLCSVIPHAALHSFNTLVNDGVDKEIAYIECWYEVKLIVDTLIRLGPYEFYKLISPNALLGSQVGEALFFDLDYQNKLQSLYHNIKSGNFSESIQNLNVQQIKSEILEFWKKQPLNSTHDELKDRLY